MPTREQTIGLAVICVIATVALCGIVTAILIYLRSKKKNNHEYVHIAIDESLRRKVKLDTGPSLAEKQDDMLMRARFYLRNTDFELVSPLWQIGKCDRKYHFEVKSIDHPGQFILTLQLKGDKTKLPLQSPSLRQTVKNMLTELKHPYILPTLEADFLQGQQTVLVTIRPFSGKRGSLRDIIYKAKPARSYAAKYKDMNCPGTGLSVKYIRQFGRQILEALDFLQIIGFPYPDLHCGNIIIIDGICKLTDYENIILGQEAHFASFTEKQSILQNFANILFELSCGFEPTPHDIKNPPANCNEEVVKIINAIYFSKSLPTLDDVIALPFFNVTPKGLTEDAGDETDMMKNEYIEVLKVLTGEKTLIRKTKKKRVPQKVAKSPMVSSSMGKSSPITSPPNSYGSPNTSSIPAPPPIKTAPPPPSSLGLKPPSKPVPPPAGAPDRSSLLADIRNSKKSVKLKSVGQINDRSSPII